MKWLNSVNRFGESGLYWLGLLLLALTMEGVALFYQYQWDYAPCVLCIHVRVLLLGIMVLAALVLLSGRWRYGVGAGHLLLVLLMGGMLERSWQLLATERGWIFGSCNMDAGLPDWFALDRWFPRVFEVKEACGYTPELLFGITMAEALLLFSAVMLLWAFVLSALWLLQVTHLLGNGRKE